MATTSTPSVAQLERARHYATRLAWTIAKAIGRPPIERDGHLSQARAVLVELRRILDPAIPAR